LKLPLKNELVGTAAEEETEAAWLLLTVAEADAEVDATELVALTEPEAETVLLVTVAAAEEEDLVPAARVVVARTLEVVFEVVLEEALVVFIPTRPVVVERATVVEVTRALELLVPMARAVEVVARLEVEVARALELELLAFFVVVARAEVVARVVTWVARDEVEVARALELERVLCIARAVVDVVARAVDVELLLVLEAVAVVARAVVEVVARVVT